MGPVLLGIVALIYLGVGASEASAGNTGLAIAFAAYAVSNLGFIWEMLR